MVSIFVFERAPSAGAVFIGDPLHGVVMHGFVLMFDRKIHPAFSGAQLLHTSFLGFFAFDAWYSALTPKWSLQVGLLHSVQIPPPKVLNSVPQT